MSHFTTATLRRHDVDPLAAARAASRMQLQGASCQLAYLDVTFQDRVDAKDQVRFKRHWQRRVQPGDPDVVTLRDVKDVVLFQVQQGLPADLLTLFHTRPVDRFLRTLILYCFYYIQVGRDYHTLLMGEGAAWKYHHMSNGVQSWSQRDARLWELLLRLAVRVTWVALQRRYLNLVDAEVGRLFRGDAFNLAARRQSGSRRSDSGYKSRRQVRDVREEILHGPEDGSGGFLNLFAQSPATRELLGRPGRPGEEPHWTLLALGRLELPWLAESLRRVEAAYTLSEEQLVREHASYIGIMGMPRGHLDVMLNLRDKQRRHELLFSSSVAQQCSALFPAHDETNYEQPEPEPGTFPYP
ncbi:uncharacterized protein LOC117647491 [Thrips palmi]|uniref:Uncharacterized protein LOC117647491 n=1 Tax=Thrips palmi TaxID=161013 RepID=A0A6P8YYA8_THRPL|nr:uncharacterized protein LOC117647491 [Thrips palmi]